MGREGVVLIINFYPMYEKRGFQLLAKYVLAKWYGEIFKNVYKFKLGMKVIFALIILCLFCIPFLYYYSEFGDYAISYQHESWGEFGDFIGGIYNPIVGISTILLTLIVAYNGNKIVKQQSQPYCNIIFNDYENLVGVDIENAGNGPLIIKSIFIYESSGSDKENIEILDILPPLPEGEKWSNYVEEVEGRAISAGNRLNLFMLKLNENPSDTRKKLREELREKIYSKVIEVTFTDIHNQEFPKAKREMKFFNRHNVEKREMKYKAKSTRLFDTFSENLAWVLSRFNGKLNIDEYDDSDRLYLCPLSLLVFSHKTIRVESDDMLTLEHVPPKCLGGKGICLTTKKHNNTASELDVLLNSRVHVFNAYENNEPLVTQANINGILNVKMEWSERRGKPHFRFTGNLNYPKAKELLSDIKSGKEFNVDTVIPKNYFSPKTKVSVLKNAYLIAFSKIGYELIFGMKRLVHPFYDRIRNVIHDKDDSFDLWFVNEYKYPDEMEGICFIITETKRIAISICFQINSTLKVQVFLPCPEDDDFNEKDIFPNLRNYRYYSINQFLPIVGCDNEIDRESYWKLYRESKNILTN